MPYPKTKAIQEKRRARAEKVQAESDYKSLSIEEQAKRNPNRFEMVDGELTKVPRKNKRTS